MADKIAPLVNTFTGERVQVPASQVQSQLATGAWRRETREEYNAAEARKAATEGLGAQIETGVEAIGRSLSAGGTDLLAAGTLSSKELEERRWRSETDLATGLELGTDVVTAIGSGGTAAIVKQGAKQALKKGGKELVEEGVEQLAREGVEQGTESLAKRGVEAVTKAGDVALKAAPGTALQAGTQLLGEGVQAGLKRAGVNETLARVGGMTVEGAADATIYKIRENVSEASLGDEELNAEKLLAGTGDALMLGGLTGGAFGLAAGAASKAVGKSKELIADLRGKGVPDPIIDAAASVGALGGAGTKQEVRRLFTDPNIRKNWQAREQLLPEISTRVAKSFDDMKAVEKVEKSIFAGEIKAENVARTIRRNEGDAAKQFTAASRATDDLGKMLGNHEVIDEAGRRIVRQRPELFESVVGKRNAGELRAIHSRAQKRLEAARTSDDVGTASFLALEETKRELRDLRSRIPKATMGADTTGQRQLEALGQIVKEHEFSAARLLEDAETWGAAGASQQFRNAAYRELAETGDAFEALFTKSTREREQLGGKFSRYHDPDKIRSFVNNLDNEQRQMVQDQARRHLDAREKLLSGMLEHGDVPADSIADFQKALTATRDAKATFATAADTVRDIHMMDRMLRQENEGIMAARPVTGAILGGVIGGPVGAIGSAALAGLMRPASLMRQLVVVESMAQRLKKLDSQLDKSVAAHVRAVTRRVGATATMAARGVSKAAPPAVAKFYGEDSKERRRRVERDVAKLRDLRDRPEVALERARRVTSGLTDSAPGVTSAMTVKHTQAMQFLASKIPPTPPQQSPFTKPKPQRLTDQQVDTMARYMTAIAHPRSLLDDLRSGTLTSEAVEAVRAVYPRFHGELKSRIVREFSKAEGEVPFNATVQLSLMFGVPLHPMMTPQFRAEQDARWEAAAQSTQAPQPGQPSPSAAMKAAESAATLSDKVAASL